jgi:extracellular factor (EF) 3-hydroxypalmitic acid methyl ester biosynthesis protein
MAIAHRFVPTAGPATISTDAVDELLDITASMIGHPEETAEAMGTLIAELGAFWSIASVPRWAEIVAQCRAHRLHSLLAQDPFTARARAKPRGYAGDAVMIDYIYRGLRKCERDEVTPLGRLLFDFTAGLSAAARAVRDRRGLLAAHIDATARRVDMPRILAVACGHLREAVISDAVRTESIGQLVALDQDAQSLDTLRDAYATVPAIDVVHGTVRDLLTGTLDLHGFDLIYAAGLYDYLPDRAARALTTDLALRLNPGGELLVGNFLPAPQCVGFMEALMDWSLVWRTEVQVADLGGGIPAGVIASSTTFTDATDSIAYLQLTRR